MDRIVGIGECIVSNDENDTIKTFALGSCVAVTVYSPFNKVAGMAHVALPYPDLSGEDDKTRPYYYAVTAVPKLINKICSEYGCLKGGLKIELFGGAKSIRDNDVFNIGQRNVNTIKKIFNGMNLACGISETGGICSRTICMEVATGKISVSTHPMTI